MLLDGGVYLAQPDADGRFSVELSLLDEAVERSSSTLRSTARSGSFPGLPGFVMPGAPRWNAGPSTEAA